MTDFRFGNERVVDPAGFGIHARGSGSVRPRRIDTTG